MKIYYKVNDNTSIDIKERSESDVEFYDISIKFDTPAVPSPIKFSFKPDVHDLYSVFSPAADGRRNLEPSWRTNKVSARLAFNAPVISAVTREGLNGITLALSDAKIPTELSVGMIEETGGPICTVTLFSSPISKTDSFSVTLRVDRRRIRYEGAIASTVDWWEHTCGYTPAPVPNDATLPMNSAWYSYHQEIDVEDIISECELSKPLGMQTLILDDGWQTEDISHGYAYCGDWRLCKKKIPDMRAFVDRVHAIGMKFMLWYSVPYVGIHSEAFVRFRDMLLDYDEKKKWFCLDPRFPEVRQYLTDIYVTALREWDLDGFKLDFIDAFILTSSSAEYNSGRDTESLEDALDMLLSEVYTSLSAIKPDIMIEFRQRYIGPTVRKYGNMLRVRDCPADPLLNRYAIADLRLTSGKTAVHSDMLLWKYDATVEEAATALVSVLYSVPQISMKLKALPEEHLRMLKFYLSFIRENRDVLLFGSFTADNPETHYSRISASNNGKTITTLYDNRLAAVPDDFTSYTVVNGTAYTELVIDAKTDIAGEIINCMGEHVERVDLKRGLNRVGVPRCGIIVLKKE